MSASGSGRTPGEWYAVKDRWRWTVSARDPFGDGEDCWLADVGSGVERAAVDARLMAAAPELYAIVAELWDNADGTRTVGCYRALIEPEMVARIESALAKAEGREPQP